MLGPYLEMYITNNNLLLIFISAGEEVIRQLVIPRNDVELEYIQNNPSTEKTRKRLKNPNDLNSDLQDIYYQMFNLEPNPGFRPLPCEIYDSTIILKRVSTQNIILKLEYTPESEYTPGMVNYHGQLPAVWDYLYQLFYQDANQPVMIMNSNSIPVRGNNEFEWPIAVSGPTDWQIGSYNPVMIIGDKNNGDRNPVATVPGYTT